MRAIEEAINELDRRVNILEKALNKQEPQDGWCSFEADLILPKADIDGLHFNETEVHAVFEKKEDGCWHSRDILGLSARNTKDDNSRDILTKYLNCRYFKDCIRYHLPEEIFVERVTDTELEIFLPEKAEGTKRYNGAVCAYWLKEPYSGSTGYFCCVGSAGSASHTHATGAYGFAPVFRVRQGVIQ
jgi:hypothetical protein